jgi:hypothetical protein
MPAAAPTDVLARTHALLAGLPPAEVPVEEADRRADEILSRPEFDEPSKSIFESVSDWVRERIAEFLSNLSGGGAGSVFTWVVLGLFVVVIVVVIVRVARTAQRDPGIVPVLAKEQRRRAADWRAEAERLEQQGDWRGALRARYRYLVTALVEREVLRDIPGRTTGEYRREVADRAPGVSGEFAGASELFERAWYGNAATGPDEARRFDELSEQVTRGAGTGRR